MKFSILIAHYNNWSYFQDCYRSIKNQTYRNFEIVIVDDFSTDDSYSRLEELSKTDPRIKLYQNSENSGVGYTKKRCVELASGDICGFVDPDDAITENALQESIDVFINEKDTIAIYSKLYICDDNLKVQRIFSNSKKIANHKSLFLNLHFEVAHFFSFRKEIYNETSGIDPNLTSSVDQDLYLKLYEKGKFHFIKKPLYLYRIHGKGVSQEKSKKEKLNQNWDKVLRNTLERRNIKQVYGKNTDDISLLQSFLIEKEDSIVKKVIRKLKW